MNTRTSLTIALPAFFMLLGGCIIVPGPDNGLTGGSGGTGNTTNTTSSSSSGDGGAAAMGGAGGAGGAGGVGGVGVCLDDLPGLHTVADCKKLPIAGVGNVCGASGMDEPVGVGTCKVGDLAFQKSIFRYDSFDVLYECLGGINPADACLPFEMDPNLPKDPVSKCVDVMYESACVSSDSAKACELIATQLCQPKEPFDTQGCLSNTNPLNQTALQALADCITKTMPVTTCQADYDACFRKLISF